MDTPTTPQGNTPQGVAIGEPSPARPAAVALPAWLTDPKTQPLAIAGGLVLVALLLRR